MKKLLIASLAIAALSLGACAALLTLHTVKLLDAWAQVPDRIADLQTAIELLPEQVIPLVTKPVLTELDKQAVGLRAELHGAVRLVNGQVSDLRGQLNQRIGESLSIVDDRSRRALSIVDNRSGQVASTAAGIRTDLKPALDNAAALVKDAQDSWDENYYDAQNLLQSSEVAVTQAAQTMQTINKAAGPTLAASQETADAVAGITTDIHTMTTAATKPKSFFGKIWAGITVVSRFAGLF